MSLKFKFKRTLRRKAGRRPTLYRFARTLPKSFAALEREAEVDLFGVFEGEARASLLLRLTGRLKALLGRILKRKKTKNRKNPRRQPTSAPLLLGALCGSLVFLSVAALSSLLLLFGSYGGRYTEVEIPDLVSMSEEEATAFMTDIFDYRIEYRSNPDAKDAYVISQSPSPHVLRRLYARDGRLTLTLTVNRAQRGASLPDTLGLSLRDASLLLKNAGISYRSVGEYSTEPIGRVVYCSHSVGETVDEGEVVILRTSLGPRLSYASLPDLTGLGESEAIARLEALSLKVGQISYAPSSAPIGSVIAQEYGKGTSLAEGTEVSLTVSGGQKYEE